MKGLTGYAVGAQTKIDDVTAALILADKLDTVKLSAVTKLDGSTTAAAEAIYKLKSGDLKLSAGASTKLDNGHSAKVVLSSAGTVSSSYSGEVAKGITGTACLQVDQAVRLPPLSLSLSHYLPSDKSSPPAGPQPPQALFFFSFLSTFHFPSLSLPRGPLSFFLCPSVRPTVRASVRPSVRRRLFVKQRPLSR